MKTPILYLFLLIVILSCEKENKLIFEPISLNNPHCNDCALVTVEYPKVLNDGKIGRTINTALAEEIIYTLNFNEDQSASDVNNAISSFQKEFGELREKYVEETTPWEATIKCTVSYEDDNVLTIKLESYLFTGGAHGYSTIHFLNFDKVKGIELDNSQLFKDKEKFIAFAETKFREQEKIPISQPINSTGFMFESETFNLPENIGYTQDGLQLFYEQYEIASYADGPIILTLPYPELKDFLVFIEKY
ncbi:PdaC/SigV domain-containing protein [Maribacter sp. CXY002]|uniref:DUF3298 and DUF4163 domain-containing protein n=1 Tax=Maribacter luteocoastalis TaxID=3407671 RepID=UPI003B685D50